MGVIILSSTCNFHYYLFTTTRMTSNLNKSGWNGKVRCDLDVKLSVEVSPFFDEYKNEYVARDQLYM